MTVRYEWKETRGGRRYVRTVVPDPASAVKVLAPDPPVVQAVTTSVEPETVTEPYPEVIVTPKRGPGRPRKVAVDE
jgi:hypothetical protein